jgi:predicted RNase H-like HicB family nuclease
MNRRTSKQTETVAAAGKKYTCELHARRSGYVIVCSTMRPAVGSGETLGQARANLRHKIEAWLEYADCHDPD